MSEPKSTDPMIASLLREREGYMRMGRVDRVAMVDEQLTLRGYTEEEEPARQLPEDRSSPPKQTAEQLPGQTRPARKATQKAD